jgi:copper homeostasis protein
MIVTNAREARLAEAAGVDRLELLRNLETGGLSPSPRTVEAVRRATSLPVRVMVRRRADLDAGTPGALQALRRDVARFVDAGADGIVLGFARGGALDVDAMADVLGARPRIPATCHRAFEWTRGSAAAKRRQLASLPQIDRAMHSGGDGPWPARARRLARLQRALGGVTLVAGGGLTLAALRALAAAHLREVHFGVWVRHPQTAGGRLVDGRVASVCRAAHGPRPGGH